MSPQRSGALVRMSDDRADTGAGVGRQEADCRALADKLGMDVTHLYRENDTSAFKRRKVALPDGTTALRVVRPEFRRMLQDLADGTIDALVAYDLDRVARDPRDLEDLIDVVEQTGRPTHSVTGNLNLSSNSGVTMARVAVAVANQASRDTSRRVLRVKEDNAAAGRWNGGGKRAYGYTVDRSAIVPAEAAIIREVAARLLAGQSSGSILSDLRAREVPTATGARWSSSTLTRIMTSGIAAGRLHYRGRDVGPAPWPAILDAETHEALVAERARRPRNDTTLAHWLSGVVVCKLCGANLRGNSGSYVCSRKLLGCNRIWINGRKLEDLMEVAILDRITVAGIPTVRAPRPPVDDSQLAELAEMWGKQEISLSEYRTARTAIIERLKEAQPPAAAKVPAWMSDVVGEWPTYSATQRRATAVRLIEAVVIHPCPDRRWRSERVEILWR